MYEDEEKRGRLRLIASQDGRDRSVIVHQDVSLYAALLDHGQEITHRLQTGRHAWLQVARGAVEAGGHQLSQGDGASLSEEESLRITGGGESSEILLFDLA
jgi:redox-sensitive bicupin YhaK (pirin superfamily)